MTYANFASLAWLLISLMGLLFHNDLLAITGMINGNAWAIAGYLKGQG